MPGRLPIHRAPMRARDRDLPPGAGASSGVARDLVGTGDVLDPPPATLDEAVAAAADRHGDKAGRMLRRFAEVPEGAFVWTWTGGPAADDGTGGDRTGSIDCADPTDRRGSTVRAEAAARPAAASTPEGATRDAPYRLGRITGPWRYDDSAAAHEVGIHHVRSAAWLPRAFADDELPAAVAATFGRGGRNFQRTHDADAEEATAALWAAHAPPG